jgi:ABC-2 type transport system permease protein
MRLRPCGHFENVDQGDKPVSHLVTAERGLLAGQAATGQVAGQAATGQVAWVLVASAALTAVFAPLPAWLYGRPR